jgi:lipoprotein-releasing system permease protein
VVVQRFGGEITDYQEAESRLARIPGVAGVTSYIATQVMVTAAGGSTGGVLRGIDPERAGRVIAIEKYLRNGSLAALAHDRDGTPGLIIGRDMARSLGVMRGDRVRIITPDGPLTPMGVIPRMKTFRVAGIFDTGMFEYDSTLIYTSLAAARNLLGLGRVVNGIELRLADIYQAPEVSRTARRMLGPDFLVRDWVRMNKTLFSALKLEKTALAVTVALIVMVAAFNIVSTLIMVVMQKNRDIAILKSMGATRGAIMRIFMLDGLVVGAVGTALGIAGGLSLCGLLARYQFIRLPDVYPLSVLPVEVVPLDVVMVSLAAVAITFAATLYPSWQAARVEPAVSLRYE